LANINSSNLTNIWEKLLEDWKLPLKGEEHKDDLEQEGNSENKDSQKCFRYGFSKNEITSNIRINWKNPVVGIGKSKYRTTRPEIIFSPLGFGRN
jgi:hypothetical protein